MFDFQKFKDDIYANQASNSKVYKQYAIQIEHYILAFKKFPEDIFQVYLYILSVDLYLQTHGIYQFFAKLYFDFDKLSSVQKIQLKKSICLCLARQRLERQCSNHPCSDQDIDFILDANLEHYLTEILKNKYSE